MFFPTTLLCDICNLFARSGMGPGIFPRPYALKGLDFHIATISIFIKNVIKSDVGK